LRLKIYKRLRIAGLSQFERQRVFNADLLAVIATQGRRWGVWGHSAFPTPNYRSDCDTVYERRRAASFQLKNLLVLIKKV